MGRGAGESTQPALRIGSLPRGNNGSAFFSRLHFGAKSAMAEILVSDLCECRPPLSSAGVFHCRQGAHVTTQAIAIYDCRPGIDCRRPTGRTHAFARMSDDCSAHCFFHCLPLFLRRRLFLSPRKALHCNWRAFSIADRLYFSRKFSVGVWTAPLPRWTPRRALERRRNTGEGPHARSKRLAALTPSLPHRKNSAGDYLGWVQGSSVRASSGWRIRRC